MNHESPAPGSDDSATTRAELLAALRHEYLQREQETERHKWLAHELHDGLLQDVLAARMHLEAISTDDKGASPEQVEMISQLLERAILEARQLVGDLHTLQQSTSMTEAITLLADDCRSGMLGGRSLDVDCQLEEIQVFNPAVMATLLRVARESLVNAARHSGASQIQFGLERQGKSLQMVISDPGVGFDASTIQADHGGLHGMQQRITALAGQLEIESAPGSGTTIRVTLPVDPP